MTRLEDFSRTRLMIHLGFIKKTWRQRKEESREGVNLASPLAPLFNGELLYEELIKLVSAAENAGN